MHHRFYPINKKIIQNSDQIFRFLKISTDYSNCVPMKNILRKIFKNLSSQLLQNILFQNVSDFLKKWRIQNFQIFARKFLRIQSFKYN